MDGSQAPRIAKRPKVLLAQGVAARRLLAVRAEAAERRFRQDDLRMLEGQALDLTALHKELFGGLVPDLPEAAGGIRGRAPLEGVLREVRVPRAPIGTRARDTCMPPGEVPKALANLTHLMRQYWQRQSSGDAAVKGLTNLTWRFFHIHPFLDGNGHVWRLCCIALARRQGYEVNRNWRVVERPYGPEMSAALQMYPADPEPLKSLLATFFARRRVG
jgi:fido (protein-threonine AMPylation protein)